MCLKNLVTFICGLFVFVSCSMDDDILGDDNSSLIPNQGSVYLSLAIKSNEIATKSTTTGGSQSGEGYEADPIRNCALFLLDTENKVVGISTIDNGSKVVTEQTINVLTKLNLVTNIIAVVNYNSSNSQSLLDCGTLDALKVYTESDPDYRIKVGEGAIDWSKIESATSSTENIPNVPVDIVVESRTSVIELDQFRVSYEGAGERPEVKLTEVSLVNLTTKGGLFSEGRDVNTNFVKINNTDLKPGIELTVRKNVYPNTNSANSIQMRIKFTVGGATSDADGNPYVRTYTINRPTVEGEFVNQSKHEYVKAGYWYILNVGVKVHTGKVECSMDYVVKDWIYTPIELDDIYGSK